MWRGTIRLGEGSFSQMQALGIEADEPGSIWIEPKGIEIRQPSPRAYDGVDVLVTASLDARLTITLSDKSGDPPQPIEMTLRSLLTQPHKNPLDDTGNRLLVSRSSGDALRIHFEREHLVFAPGELFQFEIQPHLLEPATPGLRYQAQIVGSPGGQQAWSGEYDSGEDGTATSVSLKVPETEGVYDLAISAVPPRIRKRILRKPIAERKIQLVVIDPLVRGATGAGTLAKIVEINPVTSRWWERLATVALIPGLRKGPLGNGDAAKWEHPTLGAMIQLGPGGAGPDISWEAYPLPINNPGQVHFLEVEYPSDVPQAMGISLLEPNAAGTVMPIGLDSGVYVADEEAENAPQMAKHRVVFWPRTKAPLLVITNRRQGSRAVYGKITVQSAPHSQFSGLLGRSGGGNVLPPAFPENERPRRLFAGYLDRPLFVENFSAPEALDASSHRSLDDWTTFHQGGLRLAGYLKHVGYAGVMMSVFADGSTIYPSALLAPTPRYDTGVFFASGQDPQRKDGLELLLRVFDREGLTLIPSLSFASPLPQLEALKRNHPAQAQGLEWIGADGNTWLSHNIPRQGLAPYYNLLDPRVQDAMLAVTRELTARYAGHESFGGLALQLSAEGFAQLPGDDWGFDDQTIERFQRETRSQVPGAGAQRFAARTKYLTGPGRNAWLLWRSGVVADFHRRLEKEIAASHPGAKLYLAGGTMLENRQTQYRLRPTLPQRTKVVDDALAGLGIRAPGYRADTGIVLLRPQHLKAAALSPLPAETADVEVNLVKEMDELFGATAEPGSLFYHEPLKTRLASFDAKSPFGAANTYTWLVSQLSPSGDRNRRRFAHSLAALDSQSMFDGGWLLSLGQEDALQDMISVYRMLPAERFKTVAGEFQPVTVRTLSKDGQTFIYLVNDSAWDIGISMRLDVPSQCSMEKVGNSRGVGSLVRSASDTSWKVTLRPYDLVAARFTAAEVRVLNTEVTIPDHVRRSLQRRIQDLAARVAALGNPQPLGVLDNPEFELPSDAERIPGWTSTAAMDGSVALDTKQKHSGAQSLKLTSAGQSVAVRSAPFDPPATGRLAVELWLRGANRSKPCSLKITIAGQVRDGHFEPYGLIDNIGANSSTGGDWMRYSFPIDHLPSDGLTNLSVQLELVTPGEVWIDDVQVFGLSFSDAERVELSKLISLASVKLESGRLADCERLLEGYWPQFLVANVPLTQASGPLARRPRAAVPVDPPAKKPGMLENIKEYLPRFQR